MATYEYCLAYKTKDNCFKHVKITNKTDESALFNLNDNGNPLTDVEFNAFTGGSNTAGTLENKSEHSIYILQKSSPDSAKNNCRTI